jgi:hypothetical protein
VKPLHISAIQIDRLSSLHMSENRPQRQLLAFDYFCSSVSLPKFDWFMVSTGPKRFVALESSPTEVAHSMSHGIWSQSEDDQLRRAVEKHGTNQWESVAAVVVGRTATQCRERWNFRIGPGLNKGPFAPWEDAIIVRERARIGNRWTQIAQQLPGRSSCAIKNRWYAELRKQARQEPEPASFFSITHLLSRPPVATSQMWRSDQ